MWIGSAGMAVLEEQDTAGATDDTKQQDVGSSVDQVTPTKHNHNDEESSDRQQVSQVKAPASKHANKTVNQRMTAKSRK